MVVTRHNDHYSITQTSCHDLGRIASQVFSRLRMTEHVEQIFDFGRCNGDLVWARVLPLESARSMASPNNAFPS